MQNPAIPRIIRDFDSLPFEAKHVLAQKALVHQVPEMQMNVYQLEPGGKIPAHRHTSSWDISIVTEGEIEARYFEAGESTVEVCPIGCITIVPPGTVHEISNPSHTSRATFILIQSPSDGFDFIAQR